MADTIRIDDGKLVLPQPDGSVLIVSTWGEAIIRVRWLPDGEVLRLTRTWSIADANGYCPLEGWDRDALPRPAGALSYREVDGKIEVVTEALALTIQQSPLCLSWESLANGRTPLASDHPAIAYDGQSGQLGVRHTLLRDLSEHYYGFGEKSGALDKHSRRLRMENTDAFGYDAELSDPLYKHIPFYLTLRDSEQGPVAYGIFYDTPYNCEFDMGAEIDNYYGDYRKFTAEGGDLDYYFIAGPRISDVVERYSALIGRPPLPPRWTLGYLGSTMNYTDAPDAQVQLARFVEKCHEYDIPCSGFHLSSGYSMGADGKRYVFTWNRDRVPDPAQMVRTFHEAGIRVVANIKPAMLTTHPKYEEAHNLFIKHPQEETPDLKPFWGGEGAHLDFTNPQTAAWWQKNVTEQLLAYGIDSTWNDNNEFHIREGAARCAGFGQTTPIAELRPIQTQLMVRASYAAQTAHDPERRPWLLTRAGAPGVQRYAATWTGDNRTSWKTLRYNIPMGSGLSLSGWYNIGHDIGGFAGNAPDPELFVRWVQHGIFYPRFCIHSWRMDGPVNEPWMYPDVLPIIRQAIKFRYELIPFLYSLLAAGGPVIRPTVLDFQNDDRCHTQSFEVMVGRGFLLASVLEPGGTTRTVYLPRGCGWYDWHAGAYYDGGQEITLPAPLDHIPMLCPEGAIIPMQEHDGWRIYAFPSRGTAVAEFSLLTGAGERADGSDLMTTHLQMKTDESSITLGLSGALLRNVTWVLPANEKRTVRS